MEIVEPQPVTIDQLALAHDRSFIEDFISCRRDNSFGNRSPAVAATLPYTSGAMLAAARSAIGDGGATVAPCLGFHHASYDRAGGYCTFNGLMVAACALRAEAVVGRIGILDLDQPWGEGTEDILKHLGASWVRHYSAGGHWHSPEHAARFLRGIPKIIESISDCDVILYQARADRHIDAPLGGWLTLVQLQQRDRIVFENAQR